MELNQTCDTTLLHSFFCLTSPENLTHCQYCLTLPTSHPLLSVFLGVVLKRFFNALFHTFEHDFFDLSEPVLDLSLRSLRINNSCEWYHFSFRRIHSMYSFFFIEIKSSNSFKALFEMWLYLKRFFGF